MNQTKIILNYKTVEWSITSMPCIISVFRGSLTFDMAETVANAIFGLRLDYCNSFLAGTT